MTVEYNGIITAHHRQGGGVQYSLVIEIVTPRRRRVTRRFIEPRQLERQLNELFPDRPVHVAYDPDVVLWIYWMPADEASRHALLRLMQQHYGSGRQRLPIYLTEGYGNGDVTWEMTAI